MSNTIGSTGFYRKRQLFDVTTTHSLKLLELNLWSIISETGDMYLNLVSSEAEFSVVLVAKKTVFVLFVNFVNQRLNAKVHAFDYWFCGKIRCL